MSGSIGNGGSKLASPPTPAREPSEQGGVRDPWTNAYGLGRTTIAVGTMFTLLTNDAHTLFDPFGQGLGDVFHSIPISRLSLFELVGDIEMARWVAVTLLSLVIVGWRPRITGMIHWWISFSFSTSCMVPDGGDHVATVMSLLILPVTFTDSRKWHWIEGDRVVEQSVGVVGRAVAESALWIARVQVSIIYLHAALSKLGVDEWVNGTAIYYWFVHPVFGAPEWSRGAVMWAASGTGVVVITWGVILGELLLSLGIVSRHRWWIDLTLFGLLFHFVIFLIHGLASFFFSMAGALILYLVPSDYSLRLHWSTDGACSLWGDRGRR